MPIYEYKCRECGTISERLILGSENAVGISCGRCGSLRLTRILSAASLVSKTVAHQPGHTCCGQEERCDTPPCSSGGSCRRDLP